MRVEFSPAMVARRAGSGSLRPDAGVLTERTRTAGAGTGPTWLRTLATAGPWLRCLAGRCRESGSSRAGAHGPDGRLRRLAAGGHTDIQTHSAGFRAVGCTADTDARDNTSTTGTGVAIYWLNGAKVADHYADFYDGS